MSSGMRRHSGLSVMKHTVLKTHRLSVYYVSFTLIVFYKLTLCVNFDCFFFTTIKTKPSVVQTGELVKLETSETNWRMFSTALSGVALMDSSHGVYCLWHRHLWYSSCLAQVLPVCSNLQAVPLGLCPQLPSLLSQQFYAASRSSVIHSSGFF